MTKKRISYEAAIACNSCHYYCGSEYLPCAVHPCLQENCPDFRQKEKDDNRNTGTCLFAGGVGPGGWYQIVPRDSFPVAPEFELRRVEIYGGLW